ALDGAKDAESYRLKGQALEFGGYLKKDDPRSYGDAAKAFQEALNIDPADVQAAERLAFLRRERLGNPDGGREVLDAVVKATEKDPAKHTAALLARFRHFYAVVQNPKTPSGAREPA